MEAGARLRFTKHRYYTAAHYGTPRIPNPQP